MTNVPAGRPAPAEHAHWRRTAPVLFCAIVLGLALYCAPFYFRELAHNYRQIYTYNLDSMILLRDIQQSFYRPRFQLDFVDYGQLYYNVSLGLTWVYSLFAHPDAGDVFLMLRLASFLGSAFTLLATFLFARHFLGPGIALFCAATLALDPMVAFYAIEPHPDSWQMLFVSLSVFCCALAMPGAAPAARPRHTLNLWLVYGAAAAAGAAFSTKYIGVLLFPLLLVTALAAPLRQISARAFARLMRLLSLAAAFAVLPFLYLGHKFNPDYVLTSFPRWRQLPASVLAMLVAALRLGFVAAGLASLGVAAAHGAGLDWEKRRNWVLRILLLLSLPIVFAVTFAATSPWALWQMQFLPSVYTMGQIANFGHGEKAPWYGYHWLLDLSGSLELGPVAGLLALAGTIAVLVQWRRRGYRIAATPLILVAGWALFYAGFMMLRINLAKSYYLLPMVPATAVLCGAGLAAGRAWLGRRFDRAPLSRTMAAAAVICLIAQAAITAPQFAAYSKGIHDFIGPEKQKMAAWLLACVPANKRIMTAAYSYIPPEFENAWLNTDQGGYMRLHDYKPDVVILNQTDIDYYRGPVDNSETNLLGNTDDKLRYFNTVAHSPAWSAGPSFGVYRVFLTPQLREQVAARGKGCLER